MLITIFASYKSLNHPKSNKIYFIVEKINIPNATKEELIKLKGIGEKKAEKIIVYRSKYNLKKEDLINIIGKKTFDNISSSIIF